MYKEFSVNFHMGLRTEGSPRIFEDGQCSIAEDCYFDEIGNIYSRKFINIVKEFNSKVITLLSYNYLNELIIHLGDGSLRRIDGTILSSNLSSKKFTYVEYNDILYMVNGENLKQLESNILYNIGLEAPSVNDSSFVSDASTETENYPLSKCDELWTIGPNSNCELFESLGRITITNDGDYKSNAYDGSDVLSIKIDCSSSWWVGICTPVVAYWAYDEPKNFSLYNKISMWVKCDNNAPEGGVQLIFSGTPDCSTVKTMFNLPALTADTWKEVELNINNPDILTSIYSIGINITVDPGNSVVVFVDNIYAYIDGNLNGEYYYKYTYVDANGKESGASIASDAITVTDGIIGIDVVATNNVKVKNINLYRIGGTLTDWYLVATLSNETQTYVDNIPDTSLSILFNALYNDPPPNGLSYIVEHYERIVGAKTKYYPNALLYTEEYEPEHYGSALNQQYLLGNSSKCTGILKWGKYIIFFKNNLIYVIEGNDPTAWHRRRAISHYGNIAPFALGFYIVPVFLSFLGTYFFDGDKETYISEIIQSFFVQHKKYLPDAIGCIYDDKQYISIPGISKVLVYDFSLKIFYIYNIKLTELMYNYLDGKLYGGDGNNNLVTLEENNNINSYDSFDLDIKSKAYPLNDNPNEIGNLRCISVNINTKGQDASLKIYIDEVLKQTITINTNTMEKVDSSTYPYLKGRYVEFEFTCSGDKQIEIAPPLLVNPRSFYA
jgi:hypothetical protein